MKPQLKIKTAKASDKDTWDNYVLCHPHGIAYQLFAWQEAVARAYKFQSRYLIAENNNKIKGVLPLINFQIPFTKKRLLSLPYCDAGGPLADDPSIEKRLLKHALKMAQPGMVTLRSTKPFAGLSPETTINNQKARMILDLPNGSDQFLSGLKAKVRSQVKKAFKNGLTSTMGSLNLLNDFYSVFSENMRDLGSPVHSRKWIQAVLKCYGNRAHTAIVYTPSGEPAAAGVILCHPNAVSIPWASSLRRFNMLNPNMLLYWTFLKFAADNNYPAFDFGRSTPGEGTFRFKKQWGAYPKYLHWADFEKECRPSFSDHSVSANRNLAQSFIRHLPIPAATALGKASRKYISL